MSIHKASRDAIVTAVPSVPVTVERRPFEDWEKVKNAGVARANIAVTEESPDGAPLSGYTRDNANRTVLQQHTTFFDLNSNGVITPWETYIGFRLLSWNILLALLATVIIHSGFSYPSQPKGHWLPDPLFRIYIHRLHLCKHGSDSGTYDHEGRFRAQQLADFFSKYGERVSVQGEDGGVVGETWGLTYVAALRGVAGQRCVMDFFGMFAALFEWTATYITIWPRDGIMRLEDVRGVFDGSYFYKVAGDRRAKYLQS